MTILDSELEKLIQAGATVHPDSILRHDLARELLAARKALRPFSAYAERIDGHYSSQGYPDACPAVLDPNIDGTKEIVHLGDFRRAREVLGHERTQGRLT